MSMHKTPLTPLEEAGLKAHGLDIGTPSQLSDVFRQGVAWALANRPAQTEQQPVGLGRFRDLAEFVLLEAGKHNQWQQREALAKDFLSMIEAAPIAQTADDTPAEGWPAYHKRKMTTMLGLMRGLRDRESGPPWRQRFGQPQPFDPALLNLISDAVNPTLAQILREMRERRVNHGRDTSPTLENWADRIEAALGGMPC